MTDTSSIPDEQRIKCFAGDIRLYWTNFDFKELQLGRRIS